MNVRFEVLHCGMDLRRLLREDGWVIDTRADLSASHPDVITESDARRRLNRLGILTSPAVRIAFPRHMPR